jgi:4-carboxymuconolactone decarboxylase
MRWQEAHTMADDLHEKGIKLRAQLWGEEEARKQHENLKKFDQGFADFLNDQLFGTIWTRPGLPVKTREFITMAALIALGRTNQLHVHLQAALRLGITPAEIKEVVFHMSQYSGVPTAIEAMRVFNEVAGSK